MTYALSGIALVSHHPNVTRESGERYPCEACGCGCSSAAHCWDKCCCHTDAEKLRWARQNGVRPPDFLIQRAAAKAESSHSGPRACCGSRKLSDTQKSRAEKQTSKVVLMWKAAECRGLNYIWNSLTVSLAPSIRESLSSEEHLLFWLNVSDESAISCNHHPDPPVP